MPSIRDYISKRLSENDEALKQAQDERARAQGIAGITEGVGQMVSGLSGANDFEASNYKGLHDMADAPLEDEMSRQKGHLQTVQQAGAEQEAQIKGDAYDPKSTRSRMMQTIATKYNPKLKGVEFAAADADFVKGLETTHENAQTKKDGKKNDRIKGLRGETTAGELGKQYSSYQSAERGAQAIEAFAKDPNGYGDYGTLMVSLKNLQGDQSVVKEAEMRMGKDATSTINKVLNFIDQGASGKSLQPEQRQEIVRVMRVLTDIAKGQYKKAVQPIRKQAEREGLPLDEIFSEEGLYTDAPAAPSKNPASVGPFDDPEKEARYQQFKAEMQKAKRGQK